MDLIIRINLDNAAFDFDGYDPEHYADGNEIGRILRKLADELRDSVVGLDDCNPDDLRDINGNKVGTVEVTP
jgi:hypothetical protein